MQPIIFESKLKPEGKEYKKIVYWNRFIRTKKETVCLVLAFIIGLILLLSNLGLFSIILGVILIGNPFYIIYDFNKSIKNHLNTRDKSETLPCTYTIMDNGVLTEVKEENKLSLFKWEEATDLYITLGFYMFFDKSDMKLMIRISDIPEDKRSEADTLIKTKMKENHKR